MNYHPSLSIIEIREISGERWFQTEFIYMIDWLFSFISIYKFIKSPEWKIEELLSLLNWLNQYSSDFNYF